jgi:hypothetical protein
LRAPPARKPQRAPPVLPLPPSLRRGEVSYTFPAGACAASSLAAAGGFALFAAASYSTVIAGCDLRAGLGAWAPAAWRHGGGAGGGDAAAGANPWSYAI